MRLLLTGDTHGNAGWLREFIFPTAAAMAADKIVVLGDFGYWEHTQEGVSFLDQVDVMAAKCGIPLYWLHGNHDKYSLALKLYAAHADSEGFLVCRANVLYIRQGHSWEWDGRTFRAFGGAYSVDKGYRLQMEARKYDRQLRQEQERALADHRSPRVVPSQAGTLWFPEEEMSDDTLLRLLAADPSPKQYVLSHDKPHAARVDWSRKELPLCVPNQLRLQRALEVHQPLYWVHGHLHYRYTDVITTGLNDTTVIGLEPDRDAAEVGWKHKRTWALLELRADGTDLMLPGDASEIVPDRNLYLATKKTLAATLV